MLSTVAFFLCRRGFLPGRFTEGASCATGLGVSYRRVRRRDAALTDCAETTGQDMSSGNWRHMPQRNELPSSCEEPPEAFSSNVSAAALCGSPVRSATDEELLVSV